MTATPKRAGRLPVVDVEREQPFNRLAGAGVLLAILLTLAAQVVSALHSPTKADAPSDYRQLFAVGENYNQQWIATGMRIASWLLLLAFAFQFYRVIKGRSPRHPSWTPLLAAVAVFIFVVALPLSLFQVHDVARDFLASGPRTGHRAHEMLHHKSTHGALLVANIAQYVGNLIFGIWISLTSLEAQRIGLITRFLGYFGIGAGITTAINLPIGIYLFVGWAGSVGILMLGYWPGGGRPPAWDEGREVTWDEVDARGPTQAGRAAR